MGEGDDIWVFLLVWPLAFVGVLALMLSMALAQAEDSDSGRSAKESKHLIWARVFLLLNCASCILIICLDHFLLRDPRQYRFVVWRRYWLAFLLTMVGADVWAILSMIHGFQARGRGTWVVRVAPPIIAVLSVVATMTILAASSFQ
jgi:hypothetical protein